MLRAAGRANKPKLMPAAELANEVSDLALVPFLSVGFQFRF
jgi:hypothetical protein